ncbi:hypothetical protein K438DRAFT_2017744 [Mycena galopus ATCC 62051]|nr:hypothetical protein K438DRAFT_2017744 [Mycena galopus ATCC 62051]
MRHCLDTLLTTIMPSVSLSLASRYRLISILSVAQLFSSSWTMHNYGLSDTAWSQVFLIAYMLFAFMRMHSLTKATSRTDLKLSRVDNHIESLVVVMLSGFMADIVATMLLFAPETVMPPCVADKFLGSQCVPLGLDLILPVAILTILLSAILRIRRRAEAIYGNETIGTVTPPATLIPAWAYGTVTETEHSGLAPST